VEVVFHLQRDVHLPILTTAVIVALMEAQLPQAGQLGAKEVWVAEDFDEVRCLVLVHLVQMVVVVLEQQLESCEALLGKRVLLTKVLHELFKLCGLFGGDVRKKAMPGHPLLNLLRSHHDTLRDSRTAMSKADARASA